MVVVVDSIRENVFLIIIFFRIYMTDELKNKNCELTFFFQIRFLLICCKNTENLSAYTYLLH